uniref:Signal peptide-containing protein n=1 Tax=Globodera pallida TaxID=36090 RepID=A0A183BM35_GLOPA
MKFNVLLSLLLLHNIMAFELHVQPSIRKATGNVHKYDSHQISSKHRQTENKDEKLQKWRRSELQKLANIFAGKLLNDPNFANMEFVEQSASKYYLDVDSLDKVFKKMETNGLALRTQIYEEIKTAGLLEDKGDIKENGGAAATAPNRGGIFNKLFGGGPEEEANRVDTLNSKLAAKQHELHNLDRDISTKLRQLKNIEAEIGQTNNVGQNHTEGTPIKWKKVSFADSGLSPNYQQNIDQNFMKVITSKEKNDASAAENDEETSVIKTPRRIVTLNKRKPSRNSSAPDYEADAETKAVDSKASRRLIRKMKLQTQRGNQTSVFIMILYDNRVLRKHMMKFIPAELEFYRHRGLEKLQLRKNSNELFGS